ncbi:ABC transporter ATP-binding protein [Paenibacillus sp. J31TS4]|uniref:ABC transporter ATP-binding protein n=1 Tax=Paenibacillus sp. J31TS4 TaxID=2807195 RepID=UPI001B0B5D27|nr:ABC transporter ATP-binding protein [Paenibacillus sp. J31TS4]GIP41217.1 ABC transporter ATP-binding protein [Paenibacillus sp. J31TS4]
MNESLLDVNSLTVGYRDGSRPISILNQVTFRIRKGETLGIVGESGCGKSMTSLAVMGLLASPLQVQEGSIRLEETELTGLSAKQMNRYRGKDLAMIFQEPMTSLNPVFTIGSQIEEALAIHLPLSRSEVRKRAIELLQLVGIPSPEKRHGDYPHQLSGGMRQRAMIAIALACEPRLLILDEPTTALDVTIQAQILELLASLKEKSGMSMMFITHDLGVMMKMADRVIVMYGGRIVETAPIAKLYEEPLHPYTQGLWKAIPSADTLNQRLYSIPGTVPDPREETPGCRFAGRCPHARQECLAAVPPLVPMDEDRSVACILYS